MSISASPPAPHQQETFQIPDAMSSESTQRIIDLMNDYENEAPYHIRLQSHDFAVEELRWVVRYKAEIFLKSLPDDMSLIGTPERNVMRDKQAKWTDILAQPGMLSGVGVGMLKVLVVDAWLDFDDVN